MSIFNMILAIGLSVFLIWNLTRYYKSNPEAFSFKNLNKSFFSMGILAILLIILIGFVVVLLRT